MFSCLFGAGFTAVAAYLLLCHLQIALFAGVAIGLPVGFAAGLSGTPFRAAATNALFWGTLSGCLQTILFIISL
jgi:hypothetical protein